MNWDVVGMLIAPLTVITVLVSTVLTQQTATAWVAPVGPPTRILRAFDRPVPNWLPGHRGVDLAATHGQQVKAAGPGLVLWSGTIAGRGVVVVSHSNGLRTTYEPVSGAVTTGQAVKSGQLIGTIEAGQSHCGGPIWCLHWGLRRGRDYLNPLLLLGLGRPRLKPVRQLPGSLDADRPMTSGSSRANSPPPLTAP